MGKVLIIGGGTQGLAMIRALYRLGWRVILVSNEHHNYAEDSRYVWKRYNTPLQETNNGFLTLILDIILKEKIDVIIPMGDASAVFVSENVDALQNVTKVKMPHYSDFLNGYDKNKLMAVCKQCGFPHPQTLDLKDVDIESSEEVKEFLYPAMLKPNCTTGGRGMIEIFSYDELKEKYPKLHEVYGGYHLQRFIQPGGKQVKVQLYVNEKEQLIASSVMQKLRWYPNKAGSNCCAVSITDDKTVNLCHEVLKKIKWIGFADFDLIEDPNTGELLIMEINPRVPACIQFAFAAGINWAEIIVNDYMGVLQKQYDYEEGVYLRHIGLDILWYLHADSKCNIFPSWFKFFGRKIYFQDCSDWTDPKPFILGTLHNIQKLFNPSFKKAKSLS